MFMLLGKQRRQVAWMSLSMPDAQELVHGAQVKVVLTKGYTPKFNAAFEHFLLHTGGRAVIDEMEEKLSLTAAQCQPSKDALYRFGNTSAASTWYAPSLWLPVDFNLKS